MNTLRTGFLMALLTTIFVAAGFLIGGPGGMMIAFLIALGMNFFSYWNSDRIVLSMYGAREVDEATAPRLYGIVRRLVTNARMPMPRVCIMDNPQPNAFATGRDPQHAAVCATTGILERLSDEELAGVLAHELGHVRNRDTLTMTVTATMAGAISMLANFAFFFGGSGEDRRNNPLGIVGVILIAVLAPIAAMLVQMTISRAREYEADKAGAEISGHPLWLAGALEKIASSAPRIENTVANEHPATASMFIINPLSGGAIAGLFSIHPPTEERVARLRAMAGKPATGYTPGPWG
ncbi:MAG: zinc metalloprotease HtpX [Rhizomicrobium sp.]